MPPILERDMPSGGGGGCFAKRIYFRGRFAHGSYEKNQFRGRFANYSYEKNLFRGRLRDVIFIQK